MSIYNIGSQYQELGKEILNNGILSSGRAGSRTYSLFGEQLKYDLMDGFPIETSQAVAFKPMVAELLWFLSGDTNNNNLIKLGANFWTPWALKEALTTTKHRSGYDRACELANKLNKTVQETIAFLNTMSIEEAEVVMSENNVSPTVDIETFKEGELGPIYSKMWRDFNGVDQIDELLKNLISQPTSRRHIVSAWNPSVLPDETKEHSENILNGKACLPPCHTLWQVYMREANKKQMLKYLTYQIDALTEYKSTITDVSSISQEVDDKLNMYHSAFKDLNKEDSNLTEVIEKYNLPKYRLSLQLYARSQDYPVGTVVNIASYSLLMHLLSTVVNAIPGDYVHTMGDVHVYENQVEKFKEQLTRKVKKFPKLLINPDGADRVQLYANEIKQSLTPLHTTISGLLNSDSGTVHFNTDTIKLIGYDPHPRITYKVLV